MFTQLNADDFSLLNPSLTKEMKTNREHAILCKNPATAKENFSDTFSYGCFCGKGYPNIKHSSKKSYKKLNRKQREELIAQYYLIKPYDSIDEICMKHDICYIYRGREDQACNDAIYHSFKEIQHLFRAKENKNDPKQKQCRVLASDMASFFRTIFGTGENISMMRFGTFAMTTFMVMARKSIQKSSGMLDSVEDYPSSGEKCLIE
jgi:hypothetical protein